MISSLDGYDHRLTKGTVMINGKPRKVLTRTVATASWISGAIPEALESS